MDLIELEVLPFRGQNPPNGADEGPGLTLPRSTEFLFSTEGEILPERGRSCEPNDDCLANGDRHSLIAELGVIGLMPLPLLLARRPPLARLDLNSCNCMIKFMFGPIHLLFVLTAS
jgi:hypothetical protein